MNQGSIGRGSTGGFCEGARRGRIAPRAGRLNDAPGDSADPRMMRYAPLVCPAVSAAAALTLWRGSRPLTREEK